MHAGEPAFRRLMAGSLAAAGLLLASCSMTVQAVAVPASSPAPSLAATPSVRSASPTATATPIDTPTPEPTATATATPTPDMTATAGAAVSAQWSSATQGIERIDGSMTTVGTRFQNGSMSLGDAAGRLRQLDQQAATLAQTIDRLPAPPGVDPTTLATYHQAVDQWAAAVHDVDTKVANNNIFQAPGAVNHLEQVAGSLEQQTANLHLAP